MTDTILGLLGFLMGLGCFAFGYAFARHGAAKPKANAKPESDGDRQLAESRERQAMEAEQRAFRALTGYSADIAYGVAEFPGEGEF